MKYSDYNSDFDLKNVILEAINAHNHNINGSTGFRSCDIINNTNDEIKKKVLENIEKSLNYNRNNYDDI